MENPVKDSRQAQSMLSEFEITAGIRTFNDCSCSAHSLMIRMYFTLLDNLETGLKGTGNDFMKPEQDKVRRTDSNLIRKREKKILRTPGV